MEKPKACWHCGKEDSLKIQHFPLHFWQIICLNCGALSPSKPTKKAVIKFWNTRPAPKLICPDCGKEQQ